MMQDNNSDYPGIRTVLFTTDTLGGVWNYSVELIRLLSAYSIETVLVTMGGPVDRQQREQIRAVKHLTLFERSYKLEWMDNPWDDVDKAGAWLLEIKKMVKPQIVHLNGYSHGDLCWEVPVLVVGHSCVYSWFGSVKKSEPGKEWNTYRERVRNGLCAADHVVAPSQTMLRGLQSLYGPFKESSVIYNACDSELFKPIQKEPFIFTAGRVWDEAKNIAAVVKGAQFVKWPIFIAGDHRTNDFPKIPNIHFLGRISHEEIAKVMSCASIYVLPAFYEPFGLSILEAALSGCALVLGDIESLREIWDGAALFVAPQEHDQLCDVINFLIHNVPLRETMAQKARIRARKFTSEQMAVQYRELYMKLVKNRISKVDIALNVNQ